MFYNIWIEIFGLANLGFLKFKLEDILESKIIINRFLVQHIHNKQNSNQTEIKCITHQKYFSAAAYLLVQFSLYKRNSCLIPLFGLL